MCHFKNPSRRTFTNSQAPVLPHFQVNAYSLGAFGCSHKGYRSHKNAMSSHRTKSTAYDHKYIWLLSEKQLQDSTCLDCYTDLHSTA